MPIVTQCTFPGCRTKTMGPLCIEHDWPVERTFVRGRPFELAEVELHLARMTESFAPNLRTTSERPAVAPSLR